MASESSATDQSTDEHPEEKKVGDVSKCADGEEIIFQPKEAAGKEEADKSKEEGLTGMASTGSVSEEKYESDNIPISDVTKKEEEHERIGEVGNSLQEIEVSNSSEPLAETKEENLRSQADDAPETPSEVQENSSDFVETSQESLISESKTKDLKDTGIKPTFENERKPEEAPSASTGVDISEDGNVEAETHEAANPESSKDKGNIEVIKYEDSKDEIQVLVPTEIHTVVVPEAAKVSEKNDVDLDNPASIEVPVKDLEVEFGFPEEQKSEECTEIEEPSSNGSVVDAGGEVVESSSYEVKPSEVAEMVEKKDDGLEVETIQTSVRDLDVIEAKPEVAQAIDSGSPASIDVPVKDLEAESGFPEEQKSEESTKTKEPSSNVSMVDAGGEVVGSSEVNPSEVAEVVEKRDDGFEVETIQSSVNNQDDIKAIEAKPELAQDQFDNYDNVPKVEGDKLADEENVVTAEDVERDSVDTGKDPAEASFDQVKAPSTTEFVNETLEVSTKELNIAPENNEVLSEDDEKSEILKEDAATSVEAPNDITTAEESLDQVIETKSASSISETQAPSEDKSVDKDKVVKEEAQDIHLDGGHEIPSVVQSDFTEKFPPQEPTISDSKTKDLKDTEIKSTTENDRKPEDALLASTGVGISVDGNVEAETLEAANPEFSKGKVDMESIKSGDSKDGIQVLVSAEIPTVAVPYASEAPEKKEIDSSNLTSIEVPVRYLEVESASPEEQKSNGSSETKELISNVSTIDAGGQVIGSSSHEVKPSEIAEVVVKNDDDLEVETVQTPLKNQNDIEAKPELAQTQFDENAFKRVEVKKDDEIFEGDIVTSTAPGGISLLAEVSSEEEKACQPGVVVEDETYLEPKNIDTVPKVAEVTSEGGRFLEGDKLVDKEKFVDSEVVERDLVDTFTDPIEAKVSSDKAKAPLTAEIVKEALEVKSKELSIAPEASEVPFDDDKLSAGDEKIESLNGEAATLVDAPKDITTAKESLFQVIEEKKSEGSVSETPVPFEDKLVDEEKDVNEEAKEINLQSQADGAEETKSTSQEPAFAKSTSGNDEELVETPLVSANVDISEDGKVVSETQEATNPESSKDKVDIDLFKSEDSKDEIQALVPDEIPSAVVPDASETPEKFDVDSSNLTSIEVPVKDLEVESGSPEEHKLKESAETKEPGSNVGTIDAGGEVVGSSSYEIMPSKIAGVVEKNDDGLEVETIKTSVKSEEDPEANPELVQYDENVSQGIEVKKDHEIVEGGIETRTVPDDVLPLATISSKEEKASEPGLVAEEEETTLKSDSNDAVPIVAEVSLEGGSFLEGDKLVNKENFVNAEAVERDFVDVSDQLKAPTNTEIVNEALEVTSKELDIAPEVNEAPAEVDKVSVVDDEKSDSLKVGDALSLEEPKSIISIKESLDQLVEEKKSVDSVSATAAPADDEVVEEEKYVNAEDEEKVLVSISTDPTVAEVSSEQLRAPEIFEVSDKKTLEDASKELNFTPEASEIPSKGDKLSAGEETSESLEDEAATSVEALKDITTTEESLDQVIEEKKSESSTSETIAPFEDKLVADNEKDVNEEAKEINLQGEAVGADEAPSVVQGGFVESLNQLVEAKKNESSVKEKEAPIDDKLVVNEDNMNAEDEERDLINTSTNATAAEVSFEKVKAPEIVEEESNKQALEVTSKELITSPEASEVPSENDELSASEEKSESLKGVVATLAEAPKNITTVEESLDQVIGERRENSVNEAEALAEDKLAVKEKNVNEQALDVLSEGVEVSAGDEERRESLKGEDATLVDAPKDITNAEELPDQVIKRKTSQDSKNEVEALGEDFYKEKDLNGEAEKIDIVDTSTDPSSAEVFSEQAKITENSDIVNDGDKEALEFTSKELNVVPEVSEVPSDGDKVSTDEEEKSESLKDEDVTSLDAPKAITAAENSIDQLIEENKSMGSKNKTEAPIETSRDFDTSKLFPQSVKDIIASETVEEEQNETSNDLSVEEKKLKDSADKTEEVKTEGILQNATDKPEKKELGVEKADIEKSKDQDIIVSSDSGGAKLTKEVLKRESTIFSKVKRSIVKAKKAILRKSPSPKTLSSEAKYENT